MNILRCSIETAKLHAWATKQRKVSSSIQRNTLFLYVEMTKHVEKISSASVRKGFHHLPSYTADVQLVPKDLLKRNAVQSEEEIKCKNLIAERNPFDKCASKLSTMIQRHNPTSPYCRLKDPHV